jgi:gliding motility-associated-like protein
MNFGGVGANIRTVINGIPNAISGCNPLKVEAFDSLSKAQAFFWNWGDGSKIDTLFGSSDTSHLYTLSVGVTERYYTIMLIAEDSNTCNIRDTSYKRIKVSSNFAALSFRYQKQQPCTNLAYQFTNTSTVVNPSTDPKGFVWDFGDGVTDTGSIGYPPAHTYASPGRYVVRLCVIDSFVCNSPDCFTDTINISAVAEAIFNTPASGCVPYTPVFKNNSLGGQRWIWDFGDGTTSNDFEPVNKVYNQTGTYTVRLTVIDSSTCNIIDDTAMIITVFPNPTASGYANPVIGEANKPINFFNTSSGAIRYLWEFGDGDTSTDENTSHTYNESKEFTVNLIAFNEAGCSDTFPMVVVAKVIPLLDLPNAFTPGKFGPNGTISVAGFGIGKMDWRIYNRWGQIVFHTNNRKQGWDGTFKGALQPMDVYTYTLDVEFTDGKKFRKTGDITLLR